MTSLVSPQWVWFHNSFLKRYIHHAPKFTSLSLRYIKSLQKDISSPIKLSKNHTPLRIILLEWTRMKPFRRRCFAFCSELKSQNINLYKLRKEDEQYLQNIQSISLKIVFWTVLLSLDCLNATVGAILQLLLWCSSTSSPANQSSFSKLLSSLIFLPPNITDSTFFCFNISSATPTSIFTLLALASVSMFGLHGPKLDPSAY